jgi:hypothetical protein
LSSLETDCGETALRLVAWMGGDAAGGQVRKDDTAVAIEGRASLDLRLPVRQFVLSTACSDGSPAARGPDAPNLIN